MTCHIEDLKGGGLLLGETLESSLELGEKHEAFVSKCKSVCSCYLDFTVLRIELKLACLF